MDQKKLRKDGEPHKFMEKFFTKLKAAKHSSEDKVKESKRVTPSSSTESQTLALWDNPKITADNMMEFSEQLHQLLRNLQEMKEVNFYTYDYPKIDEIPARCKEKIAKSTLMSGCPIHPDRGGYTVHPVPTPEETLLLRRSKDNEKGSSQKLRLLSRGNAISGAPSKKEAMELKNLFRDVRAAAIDIERLKKQRQAVKKEKCLAQKRLDKLKEEEIKELESIINVYAKPLFCKWESIKNTQKPEVLENFMNEVMGKYTAMEILQELIKRKLGKLVKKQSTSNQFVLKKNVSSSNMGNKMRNQERTTSSWNIGNTQDIFKIGTQSTERSSKTTAERDLIRINRRKRQRELRDEKRRQITDTINATNTSSSGTTNVGLDLQLVPIDHLPNEEIEEVMFRPTSALPALPARSPPVLNIEYTSDGDSVSLSSSDFIIENFVQNANREMQTDLQNEMRTVLQALFGEIHQIPQLGYGGRNRRNNSGNDLRSPRTASH